MKVMYGIGKIDRRVQGSVLVIGVFDGVHLGHQALINNALKRAKVLGKKVCVLTFWPHPLHVVKPALKLPLIVSLEHRLNLLGKMGVDHCVVARFSNSFSRISASNFIKRYVLKKLYPVEVFVGSDFRFGHNRDGSLEYFKEVGVSQGFKVNVFAPIPVNKKSLALGKVSSTLIRKCIAEGNLKQAQKLLGRFVSVMGKVVRGDARGQKLGFPTANIKISKELLPPMGVYAVKVILNKKTYRGMANIGRSPSFNSLASPILLEVHVFNLAKKIYRSIITIEFIKKIRLEKIFSEKEDLIDQLKRDELVVKKILSCHK